MIALWVFLLYDLNFVLQFFYESPLNTIVSVREGGQITSGRDEVGDE